MFSQNLGPFASIVQINQVKTAKSIMNNNEVIGFFVVIRNVSTIVRPHKVHNILICLFLSFLVRFSLRSLQSLAR